MSDPHAFKKSVANFEGHFKDVINRLGLPVNYKFKVKIVDMKRSLVEIHLGKDVLHFLNGPGRLHVENYLKKVHMTEVFQKTGSEIYILRIDDGKVITKGDLSLTCLNCALNKFLSNLEKIKEEHDLFAVSMQSELDAMIRAEMPILLSRKRQMHVCCKKKGVCRVVIRLNTIYFDLGTGKFKELIQKAEKIYDEFKATFEPILKIEAGCGHHVGKLLVIPTIDVSGKTSEEILEKIKARVSDDPDLRYFLTKR